MIGVPATGGVFSPNGNNRLQQTLELNREQTLTTVVLLYHAKPVSTNQCPLLPKLSFYSCLRFARIAVRER